MPTLAFELDELVALLMPCRLALLTAFGWPFAIARKRCIGNSSAASHAKEMANFCQGVVFRFPCPAPGPTESPHLHCSPPLSEAGRDGGGGFLFSVRVPASGVHAGLAWFTVGVSSG